MHCRWLWVAAASVASLFAAEIGIEFSGVIGKGQEVQVALTNTSSGTSQWLPVGGSYAGYRVASYDAKTETLVLTKDGKEYRLGLKQAKVQNGGSKAPPELEKAVLNNLRMLAAASDQYYLENGPARPMTNWSDRRNTSKRSRPWMERITGHWCFARARNSR